MKRAGITEADVRRAVQQLVKEGRAPSPTNVRLELGGRGSYSTIGPLLKAVLEKRAQERGMPPISASVQGKSKELLEALWMDAVGAASARNDELREDYEVKIGHLYKDLEERQDALDRITFELVSMQSALREEEHKTLALRRQVEELESEVIRLTATVDEQRVERESLLTRLQCLSAQVGLSKAA